MRTFWVVLITLIITAGVIGAGGWWYMKAKAEREKKELQTQIDNLKSEIKKLKDESSEGTSGAKDSETNLNAAKKVVGQYLDAKKTRMLANAKPYMTDTFYKTWTAEGFSGTSSPSMGRYEVLAAEYVPATDVYKVTARVYCILQVETGYNTNSYMVVNQNGKFLVNEMIEGEFTSTQ